MLKSIDSLRDSVSGPLVETCGSEVRMITAEVHGNEVRGLALCPGKVVRYVLEAQTSRLRTSDMLRITRSKKKPAA